MALLEDQKCKVIILSEDHYKPERLAVSESDVIQFITKNVTLPTDSVLYLTEGKIISSFFTNMSTKLTNVCKQINTQEFPKQMNEEYRCILNITKLMIILSQSDSYYNSVKLGKPLTIGAQGEPFNDKYGMKLYLISQFENLIDEKTELDKPVLSSFIHLIGNLFVRKHIDENNYEKVVSRLLEVAKEHYAKYGDIKIGKLNCIELFTQLQETTNTFARVSIIKQTRIDSLKYRNKLIVEKLKRLVTERNIKIIFIVAGGNHYHDMYKQINESTNMKIVEDFQTYLNQKYFLEFIPKSTDDIIYKKYLSYKKKYLDLKKKLKNK
jgi:hypothetical protein